MDRVTDGSSLFNLVFIVKEFTNIMFLRPLKRIYKTICIRLDTGMPKHTVRRVHVMPWATPIRRIGKMRKGYLCLCNDNVIMEIGYRGIIQFSPQFYKNNSDNLIFKISLRGLNSGDLLIFQ